MSYADLSPEDSIRINRWEEEIKDLAGEAHDLALSDPDEALLKLDGVIAVANEWRALLQMRAAEASEPYTEAYDSGWVADFNRSR